MVLALAEKAIWLIKEHCRRYGEAPLLEGAISLLERAGVQARTWQTMAQMITNYEYAREIVMKEEPSDDGD